MLPAATTSGLLAILLYTLATVVLGMQIRKSHRMAKGHFIGLGVLALIFHAASVHAQMFINGGINLGLYPIASLVGALVVALAVTTSLYRPIENVVIAAYPFAAITIGLSLLLEGSPTLRHDLGTGVIVHIVLSILAYSVLAIAAAHSVLLTLQNRKLRAHRLEGLPRILPPVQTMELMLFELIWAGFILLSLSIATGFLFLENMLQQHVAHKTALTLIAWTIFGILLWGRYKLGWRGTRAMRWTTSGFAVLAIAFMGSKWVLEQLLGR